MQKQTERERYKEIDKQRSIIFIFWPKIEKKRFEITLPQWLNITMFFYVVFWYLSSIAIYPDHNKGPDLCMSLDPSNFNKMSEIFNKAINM